MQNSIITEYIERFEKGTEKLDGEAAEKLYQMLESLYPDGKFSVDAAVTMRLCRLLYEHCHEKGDDQKAIAVIYYGCSSELLLFFMMDETGFLTFPKLCDEYLADAGRLSELSRMQLLKALPYRSFTGKREEMVKMPNVIRKVDGIFRSVMKEIRDDGERKTAENIYFGFIVNSMDAFNNVLRIYEGEKKHGKSGYTEEDKKAFQEVLEELIKKYDEISAEIQMDPFKELTVAIVIARALFHVGRISFDEFVKRLEETASRDERDPMSNISFYDRGCIQLIEKADG